MDLVAVQGHPLRIAAELPVSSRADGPAASTPNVCTALLECQQLLSTESLVVDLRGSFNQILKVSSEQEVTQIDEFAVVFVFDVDDSPSVLTSTNLLAINHDGLLGTDDGEGDEAL